jgi:hypothetical protein
MVIIDGTTGNVCGRKVVFLSTAWNSFVFYKLAYIHVYVLVVQGRVSLC